MRRPKVMKSLLEDFFNLTYGCMLEFFKLLGGKPGGFREEAYKFGYVGLTIRKYFNSELAYLCFLEEYVSMVSKWFEVFSYLIDMLGSKEYHRILWEKVPLTEVINVSGIDVSFLKFSARNFLYPNLSDLEAICRSLLEKSKNFQEQVEWLKDKPSKLFMSLMENQARGWLILYEEMQSILHSLNQMEDKSQIVSNLTLIANKCISFFEMIKQTSKYVKVSDNTLMHFMKGGFVDFPDAFQKLRKDMTELSNYIMKIYEHLLNCFINISTALWGEKVALFKTENFIKNKIKAKGLLSKNLSIKDLTFRLALARSELGQAQLASQGADEKRIEIGLLENHLPKIEGVQVLLNRVTKILEIREKYLYKLNDIMVDLQEILQKSTESEKPIFTK